eukprot:4179196-Pyramimonas_sp.AAC.1
MTAYKSTWRRTQPCAVVNAAIGLGGGGRMRAVPLEPSVEPPTGPRNAVLSGRNAWSKGCAGWWRTHAG